MLAQLFAAAQPALTIKDLQIANTLPPGGPGRAELTIATLQAAPSGAMAALLRLLGLGRTTTIQVTTHRVARVDQGPSVRDTSILPLAKVSTLHHGFKKPIALLILGAPVLLFSLVMLAAAGVAGLGPLVVGGGMIAAYFLSSMTYSLTLASVGGMPIFIKVKVKEANEMIRLCESIATLMRQSDGALDAQPRAAAPSPPANGPSAPFPPARA